MNIESMPLLERVLYHEQENYHPDQKYYNSRQIAENLNLSVRYVQRLCKEGKFYTAHQLRNRKEWQVTVEEVNALLIVPRNMLKAKFESDLSKSKGE